MEKLYDKNSESNQNERKKSVLAMEYLARQINDEDVFENWLSVGVADGDIPYGSTDVNDVDDYYIEPDNYKELVGVFLRCMKNAWNSGSLYCGSVVGEDKEDWKEKRRA